ncbi:MAG: DUF3127 domain-containing protein [Bacteroidota bacterium]
MANFEIEGKLHRKFDVENKSQTFQAREFVIEVPDGNYPQFIKFQLTQDRCALLDNYKEGEMMKVHFELKGREWQGKYFTNLSAWRLEKSSASAAAPALPPAAAHDFPTAADEPVHAHGDLPF